MYFSRHFRHTNNVGYSQPKTTNESQSWTPLFTKIGDTTGNYALSDITCTGMTFDGDRIQFLDSKTSATYFSAVYLTDEDYSGMEGWWDPDGSWDPDNDRVDDQTFANGTSFLAFFGSGNEIQFNYSGEVTKGTKTFSFSNDEGQNESVFFGNMLPVNLTLAQITCTGMTFDGDRLQYLDPLSSAACFSCVYLTEEDYGAEMKGWWDPDGSWGEDDRVDDTSVPAGQAFLAFFASGNDITVTFPNVVE